MANKNIDAQAFCPFYVSESNNTITCEGIIGDRLISHFDSIDEKKAHEENFCIGKCCNGCAIHNAIMINYLPYQTSEYEKLK